MQKRLLFLVLSRLAQPARAGLRTVRHQGHPRRRHTAHRSRHGLQLSCRQGRRHDDRREGVRQRSTRFSPPASSGTSASRPRATCSSSWCRSGRRSRRSSSPAPRNSTRNSAEGDQADRSRRRRASSTSALLDRAEQELKRQYLSRGHYGAQISTTVTPLERNRVALNFDGRRRRGREDPPDQHHRQPGIQRARI